MQLLLWCLCLYRAGCFPLFRFGGVVCYVCTYCHSGYHCKIRCFAFRDKVSSCKRLIGSESLHRKLCPCLFIPSGYPRQQTWPVFNIISRRAAKYSYNITSLQVSSCYCSFFPLNLNIYSNTRDLVLDRHTMLDIKFTLHGGAALYPDPHTTIA